MDAQRLKRNEWTRYLYPLSIPSDKKVRSVTFNLKAQHQAGDVRVTDLQLQMGKHATGQTPHTSEFLKSLTYGVDERATLNTVSGWRKKGTQPKASNYYNELDERMFNIVGRGHEVVVLPNIFHEDYTQELLTSGLELELYAKEDFDFLRICTNDGALMLGRKYDEDGPLREHSLNYKYTREFYFEGAKANQPITLSCELAKATLNNVEMPIGQRANVEIGVGQMNFSRQRLMVAPYGAFRLRIEFYKQVTENLTDAEGRTAPATYLKDVGIGFYGTARFKQIQGNHKF